MSYEYPTHLHAIRVRYLGPTDTRGSRVKLTSDRFEDSVTFSYDYELSSVLEMGVNWLRAHDFDVTATAELKTEFIVMSSTFRGLKAPKEYEIQGDYGSGWEVETTETTSYGAKRALADYRSNVPNVAHRIVAVQS